MKGKFALVTGAASGLGRATAMRLAGMMTGMGSNIPIPENVDRQLLQHFAGLRGMVEVNETFSSLIEAGIGQRKEASEMIEITVNVTTADGVADGYLYRPAGLGPWPGVLFFTDGIGIRTAIQEMAARLASAGYVVLMPNPFYRDGPIRDMRHAGKDEDVAEIRKRFGRFAMNIAKERGLLRDIRAYLDFLAAQESVRAGKLGCTGYCMGGNFSLQAAGHFPERIGAAASFHGGSLATDSPQSPHRLTHAVKGEVYVGVAGIDPYLQTGETDRLCGALEGAAVSHCMEFYDGAEHGFTVPGNPQYDQAAAERHWDALLKFLKRAL